MSRIATGVSGVCLLLILGWAPTPLHCQAAEKSPQQKDPGSEREKEKAARREEARAKEYEGVPWSKAYLVKGEHYVVTCNASREVANRYRDLLESAYESYSKLFEKIRSPARQTSAVWILRNYDDFRRLAGRSGIGCIYTASGRPAIPARTLVTYHGGYGATWSTDQLLLYGAALQFEHLIAEEMGNLPVWLSEGVAALLEAGRFDGNKVIHSDESGVQVGLVPRKRLLSLKKALQSGRYATLKELIRTSPRDFGSIHYAQSWSLVHWMVNADEGKHRPIFEGLWKIALKREVTPKDTEDMIREATGMEMDDFRREVWKPYVQDLEPTPTGVIVGSTFKSRWMKVEVSRPGEGWTWDQDDLPVHLQARMRNEEAQATVEIVALMNSVSIDDLLEKGLDGLFEDKVQAARRSILKETDGLVDFGEEGKFKAEEMTIGGYRAMLFVYPLGGEDVEDEIGGIAKFRAIIPTVERRYEIRAECPTPQADKVRAAFDEVVRSFKILP